MSTISSGAMRAGSMQWGGPPPRMQRGGEAGQQGPSLDELLSKIDSDGDGSITASELKSALQSDGASASGSTSTTASTSDGSSANGATSLGLNTQGFARMMGPPPGPPPGGGPGGPGGGANGLGGLTQLDSDDDGSISASEFGIDSSDDSDSSTSAAEATSQQQALFDAIDSDGSGSLSGSEVKDFAAKMREMMSAMQQDPQGHGHRGPPPTQDGDSVDYTQISISLTA